MSILLSVRTQPEGGPVAPEVAPPAANFPLAGSRIAILIHGYNNTERKALESYGKFLADSQIGGALAVGQVCEFVWPGDKPWGMFSALSYPAEIGPARESAAALYRFLKQLQPPGGWPLEIALVCHSLGNRLMLELLGNYVNDPNPPGIRFHTGCMMAAAVPVFMVDAGGALRSAAEALDRTVVLYSARDGVLHWAFPLGETVAGEGFLPTAVGRHGDPESGLWLERDDMGTYGHSDYWSGTRSAAIVASFLGVAVERQTPESVIPARDTPEGVAVEGRSLIDREMPTRSLASG
jgi:hypothetical protein